MLAATLFNMSKLIVLILSFLALFSCSENSSKIGEAKKIDNNFTILPDSVIKRKGVLEFDRRDLSKQTLLPATITQYIAAGHEPFDSAVGDINGDNIADLLLVTSTINEDSVRTYGILNDKNFRFDSLPLKRQLLVFTGQKDGSYKLACKNLNAIPCLDCCGMTDPFGGVAIKYGQILITQYCASNCKGISEYRFKFLNAKNNWYLDKIIEESYCFDYEDYSLDTMTKKDFGKVSLKTFDINKDD
jgi:hypothetical protein